jgi:small subunit ribosomal protein S9
MKTIQIKTSRKSARCKLTYKNELGNLKIDDLPISAYLYGFEIYKIIENLGYKNKEISLSTKGGGFVSKIQACKLALSKLLVKLNPKNKLELYKIDRRILRSDSRRKLPKKPECYGARAKRQKSYR